MTREELTVAVEAHLHHEGRRRGERLTRAKLAQELGFTSGLQDLSDFTGGRMSPGCRREYKAHELLEPAIEKGVEELATELYPLMGGKPLGKLKAAHAVARHLYGLDGGGE